MSSSSRTWHTYGELFKEDGDVLGAFGIGTKR